MAQEIERKFLVQGPLPQGFPQTEIRQGYLSADPARSVRIRQKGSRWLLTIKGSSSADGLSRFEWETEVDPVHGQELFALCLPGTIEKTRIEIPVGGHCYEVDVFYGENEGLVVAEIELSATDEPFEKPDWLGEEVTGDARYYNSALSRKPYKQW